MFGWLKENRRILTRFDKLAKSYTAMVRWFAPCGVCEISFHKEPSELPLSADSVEKVGLPETLEY